MVALPDGDVLISNQELPAIGLLVNGRLHEFDLRRECLVVDAGGEVRTATGGGYEASTDLNDLLRESSGAGQLE